MSTSTLDTKPSQKLFWLGVFSYATLALLAIVFYKERTIFCDVAFRFFAIIKADDYAIQANRFGSYFTQSFLYLSQAIGLPLKYVMINYSLGFVIYKALGFFICLNVLKKPKFAQTILLVDLLIVSETFYWIQSELVESLTFLIFYFAFLQYSAERKVHVLRLLLLLGMLITAVFFHPLSFINITFLSLFLFLSTDHRNFKKYILIAFPIMLGILAVKTLYFKTTYDTNASSGINNFVRFFPDYISIKSNRHFGHHLLTDYYFLPILWVIVLGYYAQKRFKMKFFLLFFFVLGYLLLINVSQPEGHIIFHMESFYMPLSLFISLAFVQDILPLLASKKAITLLTFIVVCRLIHIGFQHEKFSKPLEWKQALLKETAHLENKKLAIYYKDAPENLMLTWGSSYEFWMLSTIETGVARSIIIYDNPNTMTPGRMHLKNVFLSQWGGSAYNDLPKAYFPFQDSTHGYVFYKPLAK
ncbi:hypothetical protein [Aureispira sp. CCB-E]|uniref:hypothetical protein n=1 Tax=Aureispira sp. CCB-E TaxID=3051121 RepID=UPI0028695847|nr:hypothetical protein [Aureispira sp. CCB-E]WMX14904.1 hypothetical protein QP953_00805 [Aureispira sp. CCB-E]